MSDRTTVFIEVLDGVTQMPGGLLMQLGCDGVMLGGAGVAVGRAVAGGTASGAPA